MNNEILGFLGYAFAAAGMLFALFGAIGYYGLKRGYFCGCSSH